MADIYEGIEAHLDRFFSNNPKDPFVWDAGPITRTLPRWKVMRFAPLKQGEPWVYVTLGAWEVPTESDYRLEFFILSPREDPIHVETLAMVSHFHADPRYRVHLGKVLEIGRSWIDGSRCRHLLVSLPYPYGPDFEDCPVAGYRIRFLWLLPITEGERRFLEQHGREALERRFEEQKTNTVDPERPSVA